MENHQWDVVAKSQVSGDFTPEWMFGQEVIWGNFDGDCGDICLMSWPI